MEAQDAPKNRVGRYHLVERLAVGGMAEVFLACERGSHALDRLLVIKRILPHLADDSQFVDMFMREARVAARISHPNVVQIFELGEAGGFPFIAMEYVPGSTLKELVKAARKAELRLPVGAVVDLMAQAAAGTHAAHELRAPDGSLLNLVHRDLSPHNLMVNDDGLVKLLDFGIAKAEQGMDTTRTGMLKGKISYMSPEQCKQLKLDRRSDNYALGVVLWELLAGRKMFMNMSELGTMQAIVTGKLPDIREVRTDIPVPVLDVLDKSLQQEKSDRYQTAAEFRRAILQAADNAGLEVNNEKTARLVRTLLGEVHEQRRVSVTSAVEKTLVTLSRAQPLSTDEFAKHRPNTDSSTFHNTQSRLNPTVATAGAASVTFLLGILVTAAMAVVVLGGGLWYLQIPVGSKPSPDALPPEVVPTGEVIPVTLAPTISPDQLVSDLEPLRRYLQRTLKRPVKFTVASTYETAGDDVISGQAHFALLPYNTLMSTLRKSPHLRVLAHEVVDGSQASDGYLVVPRSADANSVRDLVGSTICYTNKLSSTGYRLPRAYIRSQGLDPDLDYKAHFSANHQQVLRDVISGECKIGATYDNNYSTATQAGIPVAQLRILVPRTGSTPNDAWVASTRADPVIIKHLREALLSFHPQKHIKKDRLGEKKRITGYVVPKEEWLKQTEP